MRHAASGVVEKTKHVGLYRDDWLTAASLDADQFVESDVISIFQVARNVTKAMADLRCLRVGRAIYETNS